MIQQGMFFAHAQPVYVARAPGRLDFMGGNVDYTGGMVLQLPLREAIRAAVQPVASSAIRVLNPGAAQYGWETTFEFPVAELSSLAAIEAACNRTAGLHWARYVLGAFHFLSERFGVFTDRGANLFLASELPPNRGVASSAALEVATLKAASAAADISLEGVALAEAGQWVENVVAHSACGIMDQAAIVLGQKDCLLPLLCQPCSPLAPIRIPKEVRIRGIDSMASRSTNSPAYETARAAAFLGYRMICEWEGLPLAMEKRAGIQRWTEPRWNGYLSSIRPSEFRSGYEQRLPQSITGRDFLSLFGEHIDPYTSIRPDHSYPVRAAVRYACEENFRIQTTKTLLESGGQGGWENALRLIGELMYQSHLAYAECGLGSGMCDELVAMARQFGFLGAKMTGGGGGGVVAVLGLAHQDDLFGKLVESYADRYGVSPNVFQGSSDGTNLCGVDCVAPFPAAEAR
jgi:galactokinase